MIVEYAPIVPPSADRQQSSGGMTLMFSGISCQRASLVRPRSFMPLNIHRRPHPASTSGTFGRSSSRATS